MKTLSVCFFSLVALLCVCVCVSVVIEYSVVLVDLTLLALVINFVFAEIGQWRFACLSLLGKRTNDWTKRIEKTVAQDFTVVTQNRCNMEFSCTAQSWRWSDGPTTTIESKVNEYTNFRKWFPLWPFICWRLYRFTRQDKRVSKSIRSCSIWIRFSTFSESLIFVCMCVCVCSFLLDFLRVNSI